MKTKTFNEKLDAYLDKLYWAGRADGSDYERGNNTSNSKEECGITKQAIIDLICETVEEAKPPYDNENPVDCITGEPVETYGYEETRNDAINEYQDNLINIVRGK